jgi:hypothetical protein
MTFEKLNLIEPILRALKTEGYTEPTPIQEQAIPVLLKDRYGKNGSFCHPHPSAPFRKTKYLRRKQADQSAYRNTYPGIGDPDQ